MVQLYFLSILCNGLCGYVLFAGNGDGTGEKSWRLPLNSPVFYLVLGILSLVTGVLKLIDPYGDGAAGAIIFGDFIPAVAGIVTGIIFIFGIYRQEVSAASNGALERFSVNLLRFKQTVGVALMAVALLHFLFGARLLLL